MILSLTIQPEPLTSVAGDPQSRANMMPRMIRKPITTTTSSSRPPPSLWHWLHSEERQ